MSQWDSPHVSVLCALFDRKWPYGRATDLVALDLPWRELPREEFMITATSTPSLFHSNLLLSSRFWIVVNFQNGFWT